MISSLEPAFAKQRQFLTCIRPGHQSKVCLCMQKTLLLFCQRKNRSLEQWRTLSTSSICWSCGLSPTSNEYLGDVWSYSLLIWWRRPSTTILFQHKRQYQSFSPKSYSKKRDRGCSRQQFNWNDLFSFYRETYIFTSSFGLLTYRGLAIAVSRVVSKEPSLAATMTATATHAHSISNFLQKFWLIVFTKY